ncbi:MAG TPA: proline dehydrogenase family protein [bacterium]|nr:proline dehydrogenase family protein [bacterium]HQG46382.1 proline dehydrogenase family protein [bacterium]HQI49244.1 proline dehydrogenase family protein [bacterium]HQJ63568.1 proline dehydrogenase family protein [bacterium]
MNLFNKLVILLLPLIPKFIVRMVAKPYVAGPALNDGIRAVKELNQKGICATMDVLGESAQKLEECQEAIDEYFKVLDAIVAERLDANISVKLTQLGLLLDKEQCYQNIRKIVAKADSLGIFVRIDMEDSAVTSDTIALFLRINDEFKRTGIVIQAYLRRSLADIVQLSARKTNYRICKGIYIEPRKIAFKDKQIVNDNYGLLVDTAFAMGSYVGIATHDEKLYWKGLELIHRHKLTREQYEFQMLLGVDEELRDIIVSAGHKLRIYVPFGKNWYAYCVRRLKENPMMAWYIVKALFGLR